MTVQLQTREFNGDKPGPRLLITGGVHGDEFEPMVALRQLIQTFDDGKSQYPDLRGSVIFVPVVNESAFVRGHRCGDDHLDLARTCPGDTNGSITEQVAAALSELIQAADFYIDLHTGGTELSVLPLTGYTLHSDAEILNAQRRMAKSFNLPVVWGTSAKLSGRSLSVARDANVPAIYAEYLGAATCDRNGVDAYYDGCLNVMAELKMIQRSPPISRVETIIEDSRPDSGHMQVCHPSPMTGYFHAAVGLGDRVECGQPLGTVVNVTGDQRFSITSDTTGIVFVLRTFPRVLQGQSIGVVAQCDPDNAGSI